MREMKTIVDLLKHRNSILKMGDVWLVWDDAREHWEVYQRKLYKKTATLHISTPDESEAVAIFGIVAKIKRGDNEETD